MAGCADGTAVPDILPHIDAFVDAIEQKLQDYILDKLEKSDLANPKNKLAGFHLIGTETRLIWSLSKIYEKRNPKKALEFAKIGMSKLKDDNKFLGKKDFENIINKYS